MTSVVPNILVLMTDQQRYDSLGSYGATIANTPNLDQLASEGVRFENGYVTSPVCTPSRASIFTGRHVPGHGVYQLYDNLPESEALFTARLQEQGYQTALIGKLHVSSIDYESHNRHPNDGFEVYEPCIEGPARMEAPYQAYARWLEDRDPEFYRAYGRSSRGIGHVPERYHFNTWATERTNHFLEHRDQSRPFCAIMSLFDPHNPYDNYPEEAAELIKRSEIEPPIEADGNGHSGPEDLRRQYGGSYLGDIADFTAEDLLEMRYGYHVAVAFADRAFGRVLRRLDELGLREKTLVIMVSDHGDMLGDHQLLVKGGFFYDSVARVPLIMRWPGRLPAGRSVASLVSTHDLAATALDAAGADDGQIQAWMPESRSLLPLAEGRVERVRDEVVSVFYNSGLSNEPRRTPYWDPPIHATMLRHGNWKLTMFHDTEERNRPPQGQLFNLEQDPKETRDLFHDPACTHIRQELTDRMLNWFMKQQLQFGGRGGRLLGREQMQNAIK
jgi:arylsulfatase